MSSGLKASASRRFANVSQPPALDIKDAKLIVPANRMTAALNRDRPPDRRQRLAKCDAPVIVMTSWFVPAGQLPTAVFELADLMLSDKVQTDADVGAAKPANSAATTISRTTQRC